MKQMWPFKNICTLIFGMVVISCGLGLAEPVKLTELRLRWESAYAKKFTELKTQYERDLKSLSVQYVQRNRLSEAKIVRDEMSIIQGSHSPRASHEKSRGDLAALNSLRVKFDRGVEENFDGKKTVYLRELNVLKAGFLKIQDVPASIAVNEEIQKIKNKKEGQVKRLPQSKEELASFLIGTQWANKNGTRSLDFKRDGTLLRLPEKGEVKSEIISSNVMKIIWSRGIVRTMTFDDDYLKFYNSSRDGWFQRILEE